MFFYRDVEIAEIQTVSIELLNDDAPKHSIGDPPKDSVHQVPATETKRDAFEEKLSQFKAKVNKFIKQGCPRTVCYIL